MALPALICLNNKLAVKAKARRQQSCHRAEAMSGLTCEEHIARHTCSQGTATHRYERSMSTYCLKNLLSPHSVALVGGSSRHGSVGRAILNNIRKAQFKGEFGFVNPRYHEIDGVATVGSIAKLAFAPELVVLTAPAAAIAGLIDEAGRPGAAGGLPLCGRGGRRPGLLGAVAGG